MKLIDVYGVTRYYHNRAIHRIGLPAKTYSHGYKYWWFNGKWHRINGSRYSINFEYSLYDCYIKINTGKLVI